GYVYNLAAGTVAIDADVIFSSNGPLVGFTHTPSTSNIVATLAGVYLFDFSVSGNEPSQFGLMVNGVAAGGGIYGTGAGTQQNNGQVVVSLLAGDIVTLRNRSSAAAVTLQTLAGGTQINVNASVVIQQLG
ncbi:MAG: hypothetical protein QOC79_1795, partial [Actinomycetota bacterium]|nr:hypothetical protein [Actinomycetota bacterium]